jgi:Restriction endonuclease
MLFQYLVGLFTLKHGARVNYSVTLGDKVPDVASGTRRDVDVTVSTPDGEVYEFAGIEAKHWKEKLDVSDVEALALKLKDMPSVTQRAIVCSAGYTKPAIKKAEHHGVDLYVIKEWTTPIEDNFPDLSPMNGPPSKVFRGWQYHLTWPEWHIHAHFNNPPQFDLIPWDQQVFKADGELHPEYPDFGTFSKAMLLAPTEILCRTKPMLARLPGGGPTPPFSHDPEPPEDPLWPYGHTFDTDKAEAYLRLPYDELHRIEAVTLQGQLSWEYSPMLYLAMEKVPTGQMFATALVGVSPVPGRMMTILIPTQGRDLTIKWVELTKDQLNAINLLQVALSD